ncbi:portal protein [Brevibacterium phage 4C]|uniref:Portal protein n=30 Tax=Agmunavirus AGM1 TaxID=2843882 RepID=A0A7D0GHR0_9CAUD|nr:portal protein [Brevibacterium phage AGM1]QDH85646.1 portal protein [Brevibacterium phage AGM2]QDH85699.1 portal protein [Brevibacterium phage AGM3]QDH85752.1 portal protein [Brevibacterium phage AGM4]QDH85805.1 portal protein [Brevibacterium phage AGM5]QDH85858.1 portal protein [Brevibacterium phage AGM6]QDH85911.1 portal protein [Brevibacterium phage AGM7]QDH85964.1 portal protein [Brevibacterium phage AGM8]QDH86017.1 portal protein [Brevibacterium phage AGM9]QDH86070.1 portal protein
MITVEQAQNKTQELSEALQFRRPAISERMNYLTGDTGRLRFASEKFKQSIQQRYTGFTDNWCAPVVEAVGERMVYLGLRPAGSLSSDTALSRAWEATGADAGIQEALAVRSAAGRSFGLVSPTDRVDRPRITFEHPEMTIVDEDPASGFRRAGLIMWADDTREYATLYTPDQVWKFERETSQKRHERNGRPVDLDGGWLPRKNNTDDTWPSKNPLGEVPIVEMKNRSFLRPEDPVSEISGVMAMQDAINLVWAYLLNALDAVTLPQRVLTGAETPTVPILGDDGQIVGERPVDLDSLTGEKILWIPNEDAKPHEWSSAQIAPFLEVTQQSVEHIAAQTRTPPHYLSGKMVNTAAEALTISEAGLVSRARQSILFVNQDVRVINRLTAIAMQRTPKEVDAISAGVPMWKDPQYRSDAQRADALLKKRQLGYPMKYLLEQDGLPPHEIDRVMEMIKEEQEQDPLGVIDRMTTTGQPDQFQGVEEQL